MKDVEKCIGALPPVSPIAPNAKPILIEQPKEDDPSRLRSIQTLIAANIPKRSKLQSWNIFLP
jgi:hypothetical protein